MLGLSPYAAEFVKLSVSRESAGFVKSRKGRRPMRVATLLKKKAAATATISDVALRRLGYGTLFAGGSAATVGGQKVLKDYSTGRKYRKAMEAQRKAQMSR